METRFKLRATKEQMYYLYNNFCVKFWERDNTVKPHYVCGYEPIFTYNVLLRHPEDVKIPHNTNYEPLVVKLLKAYNRTI